MQGGEFAHHDFVFGVLVRVYGLGMLAEIVKPRKLFPTVTGEGTFAGVFSDERVRTRGGLGWDELKREMWRGQGGRDGT